MFGTSERLTPSHLTKEHSPTVKMSGVDQIRAKIDEVEAEIAETKTEIKKAKEDGDRDMNLALQNTLASLQNNLAELRHKENRLESAGSGNAIMRESIHLFILIISFDYFVL
jgi:multidrug resistance efflux pump